MYIDAVNTYIKQAMVFKHQGDLDKAIEIELAALSKCINDGDNQVESVAVLLKALGKLFYLKNELDYSLIHFGAALEHYALLDGLIDKDFKNELLNCSFLIGCCEETFANSKLGHVFRRNLLIGDSAPGQPGNPISIKMVYEISQRGYSKYTQIMKSSTSGSPGKFLMDFYDKNFKSTPGNSQERAEENNTLNDQIDEPDDVYACELCGGTGKGGIDTENERCVLCNGWGKRGDFDKSANLNESMKLVKGLLESYFYEVIIDSQPNTLYAYSDPKESIVRPRTVVKYAGSGVQFFSIIMAFSYADIHHNEYLEFINSLNRKSTSIQFTNADDGTLLMTSNFYGNNFDDGFITFVILWKQDIEMLFKDEARKLFLVK